MAATSGSFFPYNVEWDFLSKSAINSCMLVEFSLIFYAVSGNFYIVALALLIGLFISFFGLNLTLFPVRSDHDFALVFKINLISFTRTGNRQRFTENNDRSDRHQMDIQDAYQGND